MAKHDRRGRGAGRGTHGPGVRPQAQAQPGLSAEQEAQVAELLAAVPRLADGLREAAPEGRDAVAAQLAPVEAMPEPVQRAFAARLGDLRGPSGQAAADVAHALGEEGAAKEVAREARRARIRLRSAGNLPTIEIAPAAQRAVAPATDTEAAPAAPKLVEAHVTRSREAGEVSLALAWQEGTDPEIVRGWALLLDFWHEGVKDSLFTAPMTRRRFLAETTARFKTDNERTETVSVTWAQARRLVQEALEVNAWRGVEPEAEFRRHQMMLQERLLSVPNTDEARAAVAEEEARSEREGDLPYIGSDLEPDEMVANWIGAWSFGDYGMAYDLLAADNPIRRELSRAEYIAQRRRWADEAKPASLRLTLVREQAQRASALWLPGAAGVIAPGSRRDIEVFWSITLGESPLGGAFPELPMATIASQETGRHWYWTAYSVERDRQDGRWRIARIRDEGTAAQALMIEELQKRVQEAHDTAEKVVQQQPPEPGSEAAEEALRDLTGALTVAMHYRDALIARLPLDEMLYRASVDDAQVLRNHERAAAVLEQIVGRFPGQAHTQFELGVQYFLVAAQYGRLGDASAEHIWLDRSARALRQAVESDPTAEHLQGLGEVLARQGHYTQAIEQYRRAIEREPTRATVHSDLADALMSEASGENLDEPVPIVPLSDAAQQQRIVAAGRTALVELREAARLDRNLPGLHARMGAIYDVLGQREDALLAFQEAVRQDPHDAEAHYTLGALYMNRAEPDKALPELEEAARLAPLSPAIRINLAAVFLALERWREAEREMDYVDEIRPGLPQVAELRTRLSQARNRRR
jgi:tetratricopeptide (TPR) repeat protein